MTYQCQTCGLTFNHVDESCDCYVHGNYVKIEPTTGYCSSDSHFNKALNEIHNIQNGLNKLCSSNGESIFCYACYDYPCICKPEIAEIIGVPQADWIKVNEDNAALRKVLEAAHGALTFAERLESCGQSNYQHVLNLIEQTLSKGKTE